MQVIERLFEEERLCGNPAYNQYAQQIAKEQQILTGLLNDEGQTHLERLTEVYLRQNSTILKDAFAQGFCVAVELLLESLRRRPG